MEISEDVLVTGPSIVPIMCRDVAINDNDIFYTVPFIL